MKKIISAFLLLASHLCYGQVTFENFPLIKPLKRGKPYHITWSGGDGIALIKFQLLKNENKVWEMMTTNTGSCVLRLPTNIKPGKSYRFIVFRDEKVLNELDRIVVKRRIPTAIKVTPIALAGIILLLTQPEDEQKFPLFPGPD